MKKTLLFVGLLLVAFQIKAQQVEPFKAGDKIVYAGDSITYGGHYHSYVWLYYMIRFLDRRVEMMNAGIGADVAGQIYDRLEQDILSKNPEMQGRYMQSLLDAQDQSGFLPAWSKPGQSGVMIGNHAISLLTDAWAKGIRTFNPDSALAAYYH